MYTVEVKAIDGWTRHSEWDRLTDARDQADMVRGRVVSAAGDVITSQEEIRFSADGAISIVWADGEAVRCPTQQDMDALPVGEDLTAEEIETIDE
jgi:hypothetical protein